MNRLVRKPAQWVAYTFWGKPVQSVSRWWKKLTRSPARLWRSITHTATRLLELLWHVFVVWPLKLLSMWHTSASLRHFVGGLPALLLLLAVVVMTVLIRRPIDRSSQYYIAANNTLARGDYQTARLYYDRLLEMQGPRNETLFRLLEISEAVGDTERFRLLLDRLAPLDNLVYGPAHLKKSQILLATLSGQGDLERLMRAETHLKHALRASPQSNDARASLGYLYMISGEREKAIQYLKPVVSERPEYLLLLAKAYASIGDKENALQFGTQAQHHYQQLSEAEPTNSTRRIQWADATAFLEQFPEAINILGRGILLDGNEELRKAMALVYISWSDSLERQQVVDREEQFRLLSTGLMANPNEMAFFQRIMAVLASDGPAADQAREFLTAMLAKGDTPALAHLLLGTDAGVRGEDDLAMHHLEMAINMEPNMAPAANNLAWHLSRQSPPKLEEALALTENLVKRWPQYGHYRDTRGQILLQMGRHEEALVELLAALPQLQRYRPLHVAIAQAYDELGMTELSRKHLAIAESLPENAADQQPLPELQLP